MKGWDFEPTGFAAIRTPLLPFDRFTRWMSAGPEGARAYLERALAAPEVEEALFVSSPDLAAELPVWRAARDGDRGRKIERALVRYFSRMCGRPTPFGLLAGVSVAEVAAGTRLSIGGIASHRRRTRVSAAVLAKIAATLAADPRIRFRPSSTWVRAGAKHRWLAGEPPALELVEVDDSEPLRRTLGRAERGARLEELAAALVEDDPELDLEEAEAFVSELAGGGLLVSELAPAATGDDPLAALCATLAAAAPDLPARARLERVRERLSALDAAGVRAPSREAAAAIAADLHALGGAAPLRELLHVELVKPAPEATLGARVVEEVARGVRALHQLAGGRGPGALDRFRAAFLDRFGEREVPLADALDEDHGLPFDAAAHDVLGEAVGAGARPRSVVLGARHAFVARKLGEALMAAGEPELVIEPGELEAAGLPEPPPLPDAFYAAFSVAARSEVDLREGRFTVLLAGASGPSGVSPLGRFCQSHGELRAWVERHLRAEEALAPDAVFAEIAGSPEPRVGDVVHRPLLRAYEIPVLGRSGIAPERQLPLSDLLLAAEGERLVLRSRRLGREVRPNLGNAHHFAQPRFPAVYRFLAALHQQGVASELYWDWSGFEDFTVLPRVRIGRVLLARRRWRLTARELESAIAGRERLGVPRFVTMVDLDAELPVDLENPLSVDSLLQLARDRRSILLAEQFPGPDELVVRGPEGGFAHQIVVPFVRRATPVAGAPVGAARESRAPRPVQPPATRTFLPGSEWVFAKLYASPFGIESLLRGPLLDVVRGLRAEGAASRWFLTRYEDPEPHLRLRLRGTDPEVLSRRVLRAAAEAAEAGGLRFPWRVALDTYEREVDRYGGPEAIDTAEAIFEADSDAIVDLVRIDRARRDAKWRTMVAIRSAVLLHAELGLGPEAMLRAAREAREIQRSRLGLGGDTGVRLARRYRAMRADVERLVLPAADVRPLDVDPTLGPGLAILARRSQAIAAHASTLRDLAARGRLHRPLAEIGRSLVHMSANRLFARAPNVHELVVWDAIARALESHQARARAGASAR